MLILAANAWEQSENTVFKKTSKVIITRSKWLITLVIDLQQDEIELSKVCENKVTTKMRVIPP